jgi:N-acetylmuramoyl-L-alanine amidase/putative methionine-R-sulfoxide reductase with GAF domain
LLTGWLRVKMATTTTPKPELDAAAEFAADRLPSWPHETGTLLPSTKSSATLLNHSQPAGRDALQALLAFSALHQQVRQRRALAVRNQGFEALARGHEFEPGEQFVLDEILQLVAERAIAITGADGLGIALAENNEIVLRASAGTIKPDVGARIQRDSAFSGACFRMAQIIQCDDTETDDRVNLYACRQLGARSMVAVPLCGRRRVIGLLEAFSADPFGFNDSDVRSLELLAELVVGALKPEDEDRFAQSAQVAEAKLATPVSNAVTIPGSPATGLQKSAAASNAPADLAGDDFAPRSLAQGAISALPVESLLESSSSQAINLADVPQAPVSSEQVGGEPAAAAHHRPGILLVLVLIVASAVVAAGVWWKLKNAQLGQAMVQAEPVRSRPAVVPSNKASTTPGAVPTSAAIASGNSAKGGADADLAPTEQDSSDAQEVTPELSKMPRITGVRHWSSAESSTVVLDLQDQVQYETHRLAKPDRIYFDLHDTSLAPELEGKTIDIGDALLTRVRVAQPSPGLTRVVLETKGNSNFSVSLEPNPYRLVVQVRKLGAEEKPQVKLFPETAGGEGEKMAIMIPPPTKEDLQLRARVPKMRIVVDAGHGGWDLGTVGRRGLLEKDLVLEIAQRLGKLLESRLGAEVILTRKDDSYIPLDERASLANQAQADLFVSVHANYSDLPSARGVETYYTNLFTSPNAKDLETRSGIGGKDFASATLSSADLHDRIEQSRRLAAGVQRSLYSTLSAVNPGLRDRGVKEASYVVLTETAMPGILAEVSFVSSPADEQKLENNGYREQIAEALYKGIARYAAASHPVKMAAK